MKRSTIKHSAIAVAVAAYLGAATLGTLYGGAALFQLFHKQRPAGITLTTTHDYWVQTVHPSPQRKKLYLAIGIPAVALFLFLPMALASIGPKRRDLHGSARFANRMEIQKAGLLTNEGIFVGKLGDDYLTFPGERSVLLAAPTRGGKDVAVVKPTLLTYRDSCVVLDVKGDLLEETSGFRAQHGQAVFAWAPFAEDARTHCTNPLSYIRNEYRYVVSDTLAIAQIVYTSAPGDSATAVFFAEHARNLFLGLVLYLVETPELPRSIGEVLRQASGKGRSPKDHLQGLIASRSADRPLSEACLDALNRFIGNDSENTRSGIVSTLTGPLTVFTEPLVDAATSRDDFSWDDLRRKRMTVYLVVPPNRLPDATVLLRIVYAQIINLNTKESRKQNPAFQYQCLLVNNEFTAIGRMPIYTKAVGYFAGYGLRMLTVIQAQSQLNSTYGKDDAETLVANHGMQILFAPLVQSLAEEYSRMMGTFTQKAESKGRSIGKGGASRSTSESDQRRALLLPQEFKELPVEKEVIQVEYTKPILAEKICYWKDPNFTFRLQPPVELPAIDLDLHRARVEDRIRYVTADEEFSVEHIAADFSQLPELREGASNAELAGYVRTFFNLLAHGSAVPAASALPEALAPVALAA